MIPAELKIGGHIIKVSYKEFTDDTCGELDLTTNTIWIDPSLPESQKQATLIHEALGAMNTTLHETELGHIILESLSQQIYQLLKDNPLNFHEKAGY